MNSVLSPVLFNGVLIYLDDILIYGKTQAEHDQRLAQVLSILEEQKFFVNFAKCDFDQRSLTYLGHIISEHGISVDPTKIAVVEKWPVPRSATAVRQFLGFANHFRRFIRSYAK
eukprot:366571-Chlamydomonas_euryale.AAC.6